MEKHSVITIGRELGSGGKEVGFKLAKKLGVKCYDNELLTMAAQNSGISEKLFEVHDEKPTNSFLHSLVMDTYSVNYTGYGYMDMPINNKIFLAQFETIKKIANEESCVIVGRCADYALEGNDYVTSVFIHADIDSRIKRVAKLKDISEKKAKELILKTDKKRASYYNYYSNKKWGEARTYNISIDCGMIGIDNTVNMIIDFLGKR